MYTTILVASLLIPHAYLSSQAYAQAEPSWLHGEPTPSSDIIRQPLQPIDRECTTQYIRVAALAPLQQKCVVHSDGVSVDSRLEYVRVGNDQRYYPLTGMYGFSAPGRDYIPESDVVVARGGFAFLIYTGKVSLSTGLLQSITPVYAGAKLVGYEYNHRTDLTLSDSNGPLTFGQGLGYSKNGRWLVLEVAERGLVRVDLFNNYKMELFSTLGPKYGYGSNPTMRFAVSDDGSHVAVAGGNVQLRMYEVDEMCTKTIHSGEPFSTEGYQECPNTLLNSLAITDGQYRTTWGLEFGESNYELRFYQLGNVNCPAGSQWSSGCVSWRVATAGGYQPTNERLAYLALGDSYSSGEGDVSDKGAYYLPGTKEPGQCHLSSRSYPFVLQSWWQVERSAMASVACSGAQILLDYVRQPVSYLGQGGRLKDFSPEKIAQEKNAALASKKPGVVAQVEFVKKYKPGVVTLTGGGNDVGFAEVLAYCASGASILLMSDTCSYAKEGSFSHQMLKQSIDNQYRTMTQLIHELRAASPQTKVYVVGYPQFVATNLFCSLNVALLDQQERRMIRDMTSRLNDVLSKAAADSGVAFVDIEDALDGGQLCQGSEYVSGLFDNGVLKAIDGKAFEMFHPNATGHSKMAHAIVGQVPSITSNISSLARPNAESMEVYMTAPTSRKTVVMKSVVDHNSFQVIQAPEVTFQPDTMVVVNMFSEPTQLGSFTADGNGGLAAGVVLPDTIAPGHHTVVLEGTSYSGEPITLYQFVTVTSGVPGDMDGDGVPDEQDQCNFIAEWIDEETGIDICSDADMQNDGLMIEAGGTTTNTKAKRLLLGRDTVLQDWYAQPVFIPTPYASLGLEPSPAISIKENSVTPGTKSEMSGTILVWTVGVIVALIVVVMTGIRRWHGRKTNEIQ